MRVGIPADVGGYTVLVDARNGYADTGVGPWDEADWGGDQR
jgi:hypothetical protein